MLLSLYHDQPDSTPRYARFEKEDVLARVQALDSRARRKGVESLDPSRNPLIAIGMEIEDGRVRKNRYGVFHLSWLARQHPEWPEMVMAELDEIRGRIHDAHKAPLQFLIWAGMGGSAEDKSMYNAVGLLSRGPRCYVLDSTDPAKLSAILDDMTRRSKLPLGTVLRRTLVVGMALGMTSFEPVLSLQRLAALYEKHKIDARTNFLYMALAGSLLDKFASSRRFHKVNLQLDNGDAIGGRHAGPLTRGTLYPLGLARVDLSEWISATDLSEEQILTAWRLAAFIDAQCSAGRNKITLILPKPWAGAALWTKQDFEESLGKSEQFGVKVAIGEKIKMTHYRSPKDPQQSRVFLAIQIKGADNEETQKIALLRRAGYPVAILTLPREPLLSSYMQFIHYTVFGLAYLRNMNFVMQPSVELYKSIANRLYAEAQKNAGIARTKEWQRTETSPKKAAWRGGVVLRYDRLPAGVEPKGATAPELYASIIRQLVADRRIDYGELTFFGDTRYSLRGRAVALLLRRAGDVLFRAGLKMPVDVYEGPPMNHSYHEMIIGHGRCFSTVLLAENPELPVPIPDTADYHRAQFLATQIALAERGRPVVSITLKDLTDRTLRALDEFFRQAAKHVKSQL